jgi:hypothetical protein
MSDKIDYEESSGNIFADLGLPNPELEDMLVDKAVKDFRRNRMNRFFIDTEFNGDGGDLISMAIVGERGTEFYRVIDLDHNIKIDPFVLENVLPRLNKILELEYSYTAFQTALSEFLHYHVGENSIIIADWPTDIYYFSKSLIPVGRPADCIFPFKLTMMVDHSLSSAKSKIPHNALEDARAIRDCYLKQHRI